MSVRVLLGEDNVLLREGMRGLLSATEGIEVVASDEGLLEQRPPVAQPALARA